MNMIIIIIAVTLRDATILPQNPLIKAVIFYHYRGPTQPHQLQSLLALYRCGHFLVTAIKELGHIENTKFSIYPNHQSDQSATGDPTNVLKWDSTVLNMQTLRGLSCLAWSCVIRTLVRRFPHSPSFALSLPEIPSSFLCVTLYCHITTLFCNITGSALLRGELFSGERQPLHIDSGLKKGKGKANKKRKSWWWNNK